MKIISLSAALCILSAHAVFAQTDTIAALVPPDPEFQMFDENIAPPVFPGGEAELMAFLGRTIQYPALALENNIQGTVVAVFIVGKDGALSSAEIVRDIGGGCGAEVLRVLNLMPAWKPGMLYGAPVRVRYTLPVRFKLEEDPPKKKKFRALFGN